MHGSTETVTHNWHLKNTEITLDNSDSVETTTASTTITTNDDGDDDINEAHERKNHASPH